MGVYDQAAVCLQANPDSDGLKVDDPEFEPPFTTQSTVWTSEAPADLCPHVAALFSSLERTPEQARELLCTVLALFAQPRLSRAAAAAASIIAALLAVKARACSASMAGAMRAVHSQQGIDSVHMMRALAWGMRSGCGGAQEAVEAIGRVAAAVPLLHLSEPGPLRQLLTGWLAETDGLIQLVLERASPSPQITVCSKHRWRYLHAAPVQWNVSTHMQGSARHLEPTAQAVRTC